MTREEIRNKILTDNDFVVSEINKVLTYYELKHTLRWTHDSSIIDDKESVAEHVFGMNVLCSYFLPLQEKVLDKELVNDLVLWHDMAEALVDDVTTLSKTDEHRRLETEAEAQLTKNAPDHMQEKLDRIFSIYESQETPEAKFVKAIDKLEPLFQILFLSNKLSFEEDPSKHDLTVKILDKYQDNRLKYIQDFPDILKFTIALGEEIKKTNYIHPEAC